MVQFTQYAREITLMKMILLRDVRMKVNYGQTNRKVA